MLLFRGILGQVFLSLFIRSKAAARASERFTNPAPGALDLTYTRGSIIQITWQTDLERIALTLFHGTGTEADLEYLPDSNNVTNTNSYPWAVGSVIDPNSYPTVGIETDISTKRFYFVIFNPGNTTGALTSGTFKIIDAPSASASATVSSSSSSSSSSTSTFTTITSPVPLSITSTQPSNPASSTAVATNSGMSQSAKTGIGVGIGIGIPLLFAMGICLGWKFRGGHMKTPKGSKDVHAVTAADRPFDYGTANFQQQAPQEISTPRMNHLATSHTATNELSESRRNEAYSTPIHQIE